MGDIFGSLLAIEATVAFFLESTSIGVWFFGGNKLSPRLHAITIWLVAIASNLSAFWILVANAWMQHSVGFVIRNGRAELTDFTAVVTQRFAILEFIHTPFLPTLLLGVAFANLFRGLPIDGAGLNRGGLLSLLNGYGLLGGVLFILLFAVRGALWLAIKAEGKLQERDVAAARLLWPPMLAVAVAFLSRTEWPFRAPVRV